MITNAKQATRQLAVSTPLGDDRLLLRAFRGREELSRLFCYELELLSEDDAIAGSDLLGRNVTFLARPEGGEPRFFNGYVRQFSHAGRTELASFYRASVVPWPWFLTQTSDCRIFQNRSTPEIVEGIFRDLGWSAYELNLHGDYPPREYCVQYRETDFAFVSRLMEEEGIFYFFRHENGGHTLCLADHAAAWFDLPDRDVELGAPGERGDLRDQLTRWEHAFRFRSGGWAQTDYNFQTPRRDLMSRESSLVGLPHNSVYEIYDYPGRFELTDRGGQLTRVRMEEREVAHDTVAGEATYRSFTPGGKFRIKSHTAPAEIGRQYVLSAVEHTASVNDSYAAGLDTDEPVFTVRFEALPADVPFRPERVTPRPVVEGPQTAVVVGPRGEEIYPDEFGRVKVQFHWDREGSRDEHSSCWIRVSQVHAGAGWGSMDLPRIGEEVIVGFLEGDPDRPIIKGRVYNGSNQPPFGLPAAMTRSGGKSDTHQGSGYNEITADDTAGAEQVRTNAQHDMDSAVGNNQTLQVAVDRSGDIDNNDTLTIAVDAAEEVGNNRSTRVGNNLDEVAGNHIVIEAGTAITLACGAATIHMNQAGVITISGTFVSSAAKANHSIVAPLTELVGSTALLQAGFAVFDLGGVVHVKGTSTSLNAATIDIDGGETLLIGTPLKLGEVGAPIVSAPGGLPGATAGVNLWIPVAALRVVAEHFAIQMLKHLAASQLPPAAWKILSSTAGFLTPQLLRDVLPYLGDALAKIWNLPNTALGLIVGGTGHILGETVQMVGSLVGYELPEPSLDVVDGNLEFTNNIFMFGGAMTLGNVIMYGKGPKGADNGWDSAGWGGVGPDDLERDPLTGETHTIRQHEQQHVKQGQWLGPLYIPSILATYAYAWARDGQVHGPRSVMEQGPMSTPPVP